eukprot:38372_1
MAVNKFKSARPANRNELSSTIKTITVSPAYPSQNEGIMWKSSKCSYRNRKRCQKDESENSTSLIQLTRESHQEHNNEIVSDISNKCAPGNISNCNTLYKLINTIREYNQSVNNDNEKDNTVLNLHYNIFNMLNIVNWFIHSINIHNNDQITIKTEIGDCDVMNCNTWRRQNRIRSYVKTKKQLTEMYETQECQLLAILQMLDKIHCYYCHDIDHMQQTQVLPSKQLRNAKHNQITQISPKHITRTFSTYIYGHKFHYVGSGEEEKDSVVVIPIHSSFKEELLSNKLSANAVIGIAQFDTEIEKAKLHFNSNFRKQKYQALSLNNLLALLIYCNYYHLQYEFSKTCRTLIGQDHFYHLGKHLKQAVHKCGTTVKDGCIQSFYHGVGDKLLFPIKGSGVTIYVPMSTSSSVEVATNFTNCNNGMIVEFQGDMSNAKYLSVEWLSDFAAEKEHFFFQTEDELKIINITEPQFLYEYKGIIEALDIIDQIISYGYFVILRKHCLVHDVRNPTK